MYMLTKKDRKNLIDELMQVFVTKQEFKEFKDQISLDIKHLPTKDEFFKRMDELSGEIKAMRQEFTAKKYRADQVDNLEKRVDKIEDHLDFPHSS